MNNLNNSPETNLTLKLLSVFRKVTVKLDKMFPLHSSTMKRFHPYILRVVMLSRGKKTGLSGRFRIAINFLQFLLKMSRHHGAVYTVKGLKACSVCLQKYLGDDRISTLRVIEPNVPLPRIINGLPAYINRGDRELIRKGRKDIIRFGLSLFSIYRVLKIPGVLKLKTITDPFSGDQSYLDKLIAGSGLYNPFQQLNSYGGGFDNVRLAPRVFLTSRKSSPSNVHSFAGILFDAYDIRVAYPKVEENIKWYLRCVADMRHNIRPFIIRGEQAIELADRILDQGGTLSLKKSSLSTVGQFATKAEPAGKIRLFALVDSITQSVMQPLHKALFDLLREIPNDGTFDQDASVKRSSEKAVKNGCAYSFDLSAATDRLPVLLSASILNSMFKSEIGNAGKAVLVDRDFKFTSYGEDYPDLLGKSIRYSVGQPMGALSSGAMLAITHHGILQYASNQLGFWGGEERYEILGDDLVVFDSELAKKYLEICEGLGVEINLSKSIVSKNKPVFEFAKRTVVGYDNLSAISLRALTSAVSLQARVSNALAWIKNGLISSPSLLLAMISKYPFKTTKSSSIMGALSLLGVLASQKLIQPRKVVECMVNPLDEDFDLEEAKLELPLHSILKQVIEIGKNSGSDPVDLNLPKPDPREEYVDEWEPQFVATILQIALAKAKGLEEHGDSFMFSACSHLYHLPPEAEDDILRAQVLGGWEDNYADWNKGKDPEIMCDEVEEILRYHAKTQKVTGDRALEILQKVELMNFEVVFNLIKKEKLTFKDVAPVLGLVGKAVGIHSMSYGKKPRICDL